MVMQETQSAQDWRQHRLSEVGLARNLAPQNLPETLRCARPNAEDNVLISAQCG
jgi:hypothetical protein